VKYLDSGVDAVLEVSYITFVYVDVDTKPPDWAVAHRQGNCYDLVAVAYVVHECAARATGLHNAVYFAAVWFNDTWRARRRAPLLRRLAHRGGPRGQVPDAGWGQATSTRALGLQRPLGRVARLKLYRVEGGRLLVIANGTTTEVANVLLAFKN